MRTRDLVRQHEDLFGRMAMTLSLDPMQEWEAGRVSRGELDRALSRCMTCPDPDGCALWLDQHTGGALHAPELCRNRALLERLRNRA